MGTVYKVRDRWTNKLFAVKVLSSELTKDPLSVRRFEQESEAASLLSHPNIAAHYSYNVSPDQTHFLVMEYVDGISLDKLLSKYSPGFDFTIDIFIQICDALEKAHACGIIHRDLKPANILIGTNEKGVSVVKIVDFGIAKIAASAKRQLLDLTQTGDIFGSPSYMSPEQCLGFECDARSDIYSLGCIMYETFAGRAPFEENNVIQTIVRHLDATPKPLQSNIFLPIPKSLKSTIMRALEKEPQNRYQSAQALKKDLELIKAGKKTKVLRKVRSLLPVQVAIIVAWDLILLFGSFSQYYDAVQAKFRAYGVINESNALSKVFYDAGIMLGTYSFTKETFFLERYEKLVQQIPEDVKDLDNMLGSDGQSGRTMVKISDLTNHGLKILSEAKASIEAKSPDVTSKHIYKDIRHFNDQLQVELDLLTKNSRRIIIDSIWMVRANLSFAAQLLLILISNIAIVGALLRRQKSVTRGLMWVGKVKPDRVRNRNWLSR